MLRLYLVGTDTAVGKTTVACALLRRARLAGVRAIAFKPAQTGPDHPSDAARLAEAAGLPGRASSICPLVWPDPIAPGMADDPAPFLSGHAEPVRCPALDQADAALRTLVSETQPELLLIEGAGGLHVPMPGGTWQPRWIITLATHTLVVGRAGLGTIHHTLSVIEGLRAAGRPPLGFVLSHVTAPDPSTASNATVIAARSGVPHLATFPPDPAGQDAAADTTLSALGFTAAAKP